MAVTNTELNRKLDAITERVGEVHDSVIRLEEKHARVDEHHKTLYGNGQPGLVKEWTAWKGYAKGVTAAFGVAITLLGVAQGLTGCEQSSPQQTASAFNMTYEAEATPPVVPHNSPTATAAASATPPATPTPCCGTPISTITPRPSTTPIPHIIEVNTDEIEWLAALCWIELRSFGDNRPGGCASVIDTVMTRIRSGQMTDYTIRGTILWGCNEDSETCQFPAWAVSGCEGIVPEVCPFYDSEGMIYFRGVVLGYLTGDIQPLCRGYLFYRNNAVNAACTVEDGNGNIEGWRN